MSDFVQIKRRGFLGAVAATAAASACDFSSFFQQHYKRLSDDDKRRVFARIERDQAETHGVRARVGDPPPIPGVRFAFALNLDKCNGNRRCVHACMEENNQSRDPSMQYIRVVELDRGTFHLESGDARYEGEVPKPGKIYLPMQCNQCENPSCTKACPVGATWKEADGIVVVDYDWCIGCRYCMAACPYDARRFNWATPQLAPEEVNPNQGYLSNRPRPRGVVEKCHFCLHRTREGHNPACLEACPTGARKFGDLNDPESEVSRVLKHKAVFVLKEELNTVPRFFYYFD